MRSIGMGTRKVSKEDRGSPALKKELETVRQAYETTKAENAALAAKVAELEDALAAKQASTE